jgi:hypothetical protein
MNFQVSEWIIAIYPGHTMLTIFVNSFRSLLEGFNYGQTWGL